MTYVAPGLKLIHRPIGQALAPGSTIPTTPGITVRVPIAGAGRWKIRGKMNQAGDITVTYCQPNEGAAYTTGNPAAVAVVADTEFAIEDVATFGEAELLVNLTADVEAVLAFLDICALPATTTPAA